MDNQGKRNFRKQELEVMMEEIADWKRLLLGTLKDCGVTVDRDQKERMGKSGRVCLCR